MAMTAGCGSRALDKEAEADQAKPVIEPEVERRDVKAPKIDTEDFELGAFVGFMSIEDFGSNAVLRRPARLSHHRGTVRRSHLRPVRRRQDQLRDPVGRPGAAADATISASSPTTTSRSATTCCRARSSSAGNHAFNSALYVLLGAGNTSFAGDDYFTFTYGAGWRVLPRTAIAAHFDVRDHMFDIDITGEDKTTHNIEFNLGATWFF